MNLLTILDSLTVSYKHAHQIYQLKKSVFDFLTETYTVGVYTYVYTVKLYRPGILWMGSELGRVIDKYTRNWIWGVSCV